MTINLTQKTILKSIKNKSLSVNEGMAQNIQKSLNSGLKPAGVIIPLIATQEHYEVLLTIRADHLKHHPGQISFPGGKMELSDKNLLMTALRETAEEIGLNKDYLEIIGSMRPFKSIAGYLVTPFIALVAPDYCTKIDASEVDAILTVPLDYLLDPINAQTQTILKNGEPFEIVVIKYQNYRIWGLTARILVEMGKLLA